MYAETNEPYVAVYLSRSNLKALLAKLDGYPEHSGCTIYRVCENGVALSVVAQEDEEHYASRKTGRGIMHPDTEERVVE